MQAYLDTCSFPCSSTVERTPYKGVIRVQIPTGGPLPDVAQQVERPVEDRRGVGSIPSIGTIPGWPNGKAVHC